MSRPWFPLYPADYLADTRDLDCQGHGIYLLLLMESWHRGPLPDDGRRLCAWCCGAPEGVVRAVLADYWTLTERGWINPRLEEERAKAEARSDAQRTNAARRWTPAPDAIAMPPLCHGNAMAMPPQSQTDPRAPPSQPQPQEDLRSGTPVSSIPTYPVDEPAEDGSAVDRHDETEISRKPNNGAAYRAIIEAYHEILCPPLPRVARLTEARKRHLSARLADELPEISDWRAYFAYVRDQTRLRSGFRRHDGSVWRPDFDWLIKADSVLHVEEGRYGTSKVGR